MDFSNWEVTEIEFDEEQAKKDIADIDWSNKITDGIGEDKEAE